MSESPKGSVLISIAAAALAAAFAYLAIKGLATGETQAISKQGRGPIHGREGVGVAVSYLLFAAAWTFLAIAGITTNQTLYDRFLAWTKRLLIAAGVVLLASSLLKES